MNTAITDKALLPYIRTYSGLQFRHAAPDPNDICMEDIAHALSNICRFTGHTKEFYSVAEHCVRGSYFAKDPLAFLLHDASEAYCSDINRPLKMLPGMESYRKYEEQVQEVIEQRFGLAQGALRSDDVKLVDNQMLVTEMQQVMNYKPEDIAKKNYKEATLPITLDCWNPHLAKFRYMNRFWELTRV